MGVPWIVATIRKAVAHDHCVDAQLLHAYGRAFATDDDPTLRVGQALVVNAQAIRHWLLGYVVSAAAVGAAFGLRIVLEPLTGIGAPWVMFFTAVVVATLFGGRGPGIFATLLAAPLAAAYFVVPAGHTLSQAIVQAVLFTIDGLILVYLGTLITRGRELARAAAAINARNEERLRLANEAAHIGAYDIDLIRHSTIGTPELRAILGVSDDAQFTDPELSFVHPEDRAMVRANYDRSLDPTGDGRVQLETRIARPDGELRWLYWAGRTYFDDRPQGRIAVRQVGVAVDITERKRAEAELHEAARKKDEFLAVLSHELRNPLAAIRSGVLVLERASGTEAAERAHRIIDRQVAQLTRLVDDLLDVTRISRGKLVLQRTELELGQLVKRTVDDQRAPVEARGLTLELHPTHEPLWLAGDAARLVQVIDNLLHNAAKFTPHGGRIDISLSREQGDAVMRVRDTGAGIAASDAPRMFEAFVQLESTIHRRNGGLGLGLALVKGIVELHGGTVTVASEGVGHGSEFTVRLRLGPTPELTAEPRTQDTSHTLRVLVIDDNEDVADTLADVLRVLGHEVRVANDGISGIAVARTFHPDVVICDIGLPGMDGYEVARRMRADEALSGVMLVALSGYGQPEDCKRAADAGFARHVTKPVTIDVLQRALG
jgi:PAS domain S-box-containing protein